MTDPRYWVSYTSVLSDREWLPMTENTVAQHFLAALTSRLLTSVGPDAAIIADANGRVSLIGTFAADTEADALAQARKAFSACIDATGVDHEGLDDESGRAWQSYSLDLVEVLRNVDVKVKQLDLVG